MTAIAHQNDVEQILIATFSIHGTNVELILADTFNTHDSKQISRDDYLIVGTLEKAVWRRGMQQLQPAGGWGQSERAALSREAKEVSSQ